MAWIEWHAGKALIRWRDAEGRKRSISTQIESEPQARLFLLRLGDSLDAERRRHGDTPLSAMLGFLAYLETLKRSPGTLRFYKGKLALFCRAFDHRWQDIQAGQVRAWVEAYGKDRSARSQQAMIQALGRFFTWCRTQGIPSPTLAMDSPRVPILAPTVPTRQAVEALIAHAEPPYDGILALAAYMGLRLSEIRRARWEHVRQDGTLLAVQGRKGSAPRERLVPFHDKARGVLEEATEGPLVNAGRAWWEGQRFYEPIREAYQAAGMAYPKGRPIHILRHWFCSELLARGADIETVRDMAGHENIQTTQRYAHTTTERMREASRLL